MSEEDFKSVNETLSKVCERLDKLETSRGQQGQYFHPSWYMWQHAQHDQPPQSAIGLTGESTFGNLHRTNSSPSILQSDVSSKYQEEGKEKGKFTFSSSDSNDTRQIRPDQMGVPPQIPLHGPTGIPIQRFPVLGPFPYPNSLAHPVPVYMLDQRGPAPLIQSDLKSRYEVINHQSVGYY